MMVLDATDQSIPNTKLLHHKVKGVPIRIVPLTAQLLLSVTSCHFLSLHAGGKSGCDVEEEQVWRHQLPFGHIRRVDYALQSEHHQEW
jgi:hypothetical protein